MTGVVGKAALQKFYSRDFIPCMLPDTALMLDFCTIGENQLVDEMGFFSFTHLREMPVDVAAGVVLPFNARVEVALTVNRALPRRETSRTNIFIGTQASVLAKQIRPRCYTDLALPVCRVEAARKIAQRRLAPKSA